MLNSLKMTTRVFLAHILYGFSISAYAYQYDSPEHVDLRNGSILRYIDNELTILKDNGSQRMVLRTPIFLRKTLLTASSCTFPTTHSRVIDGEEYVLTVINHRSNRRPNQYCSSGNEGVLYVLRIKDDAAEPVFSLLVESCMKGIHLERSATWPSRHIGIDWGINPIGIQIDWSHHEDWVPVTGYFFYCNGKFVQKPCQHYQPNYLAEREAGRRPRTLALADTG
ncbi:hypothetical protein KQH60_09730 [Mycetohabitans sp. B8]|uniref:hypothetical protein n=1 Tax=Mycetohabitans sp. B8 TaxID=2841845 RepID=UPI001F2501D2|nr:hypothetical protein [Mycetohabitans sp. B8]MCG1042800.1 hypothetical protein [Mycetohabitans sp. B8]